MDFLRQKFIGDWTILQVGLTVLAVIAAFWAIGFIRKLVSAQTPDQHQVRMKCYECGWQGVTSKHIPTCRKCNSKSLHPV